MALQIMTIAGELCVKQADWLTLSSKFRCVKWFHWLEYSAIWVWISLQILTLVSEINASSQLIGWSWAVNSDMSSHVIGWSSQLFEFWLFCKPWPWFESSHLIGWPWAVNSDVGLAWALSCLSVDQFAKSWPWLVRFVSSRLIGWPWAMNSDVSSHFIGSVD